MAPEIRTIIRYMDDYIQSGDYKSAISRGVQALHIYDEEREYDNSIIVLEKLLEIAERQRDNKNAMLYLDNLKVRCLLGRNEDKFNEVAKVYSNVPKTPLSELLSAQYESVSGTLIVETLDLQSIFGDYEQVDHVPYVIFQRQEDVIEMITDNFEPGRYLVNLLDTSNSLHQAINLDVGTPEEVIIVDRDHTFKLS